MLLLKINKSQFLHLVLTVVQDCSVLRKATLKLITPNKEEWTTKSQIGTQATKNKISFHDLKHFEALQAVHSSAESFSFSQAMKLPQGYMHQALVNLYKPGLQ